MRQILPVGCVVFLLLAVACGGLCAQEGTAALVDSVPDVGLQFVGHDCFLLTTQSGARILMDPYGYSYPVGLTSMPVNLEPDAVTISHTHLDHNNAGCAPGALILKAAGTWQVDDVAVAGYAWREGSPRGPIGRPNVIFVFEVAGTKTVHLGDAGAVTDPAILAAISDADVVIVNIDGYVLPFDQFMPFMNEIRARTVIVAHYTLLEASSFGGAPTVEQFFSVLPDGTVKVASAGSLLVVTPGMPTQFLAMTPSALAPTGG